MPDNVDFIQAQQAELLERQINAARVKHCGASALVTVNYANCLAASALLMSLTNASRLHALPQTVAILRCISARRVGQMSRAIVRLSGLPVARRMTLTSMRKKSREWSAFTRRISARVIFISPERRTGALCRKCQSLSL